MTRILLAFALAIPLAIPMAAQFVPDCRKLERHGNRPEARQCFEKLTESTKPAVKAEGYWALGRFEEASKNFDSAVAISPDDPEIHVRWGRLFLERFNQAEAQKEFRAALEIDEQNAGAFLGLALMASTGFESKAVELATKAIELDPKLVEAQELLAKLALEDSNPEKAVEEADKALQISPEALDAMAVRAVIDFLEDKPSSPWMDRILKINPVYGEAYAMAGHFFVLNRRYEEGIRFYRKALELDPELHAARAQLGVNLMRLGLEEEAREQLKRSFDAGYTNALTANSLTLIDSYKRFETFKTPKTIVKLHRKEAELLRPFIESELKRAIETYEKKYKMQLNVPVQVELYPDHEDFAVRTLGMPGLGALGVTFGNVVAMDSPSGRRPGTFHWASTLWHELSHVFVLTATKHRVPRWFTEGMAVHEETAISPDWGDRLDPEVIRAIKDKKLLPVERLDRGFIRPSYPAQVVVSYFQAGRICDFINETWGYDKQLAIMHSFGELATTPEAIEKHLGMKTEEFDTKFLAWLDERTGKTVAGFDEWRKRMRGLAEAAKADRHEEVIKEGTAIRDLYPDYVESGSVYELLSEAYLATNDKASAMKELERYSQIGGRDPAVLKKLAALQEEAGKKKEASETLERLLYVYPLDEELHRKLGDLWLAQGRLDGAIREYFALVATKPIDQAEARFKLASALHAAKRTNEAKEQLLLSLEAAPGYKPAQKLLLELNPLT
ncbi:MAG: tetratricopeptide repeat protein [Bryobacteraceae bacterium]